MNVNIGGRQGRLRNLDSITDPKIKIAPHLRGEVSKRFCALTKNDLLISKLVSCCKRNVPRRQSTKGNGANLQKWTN